MTTVFRGFLKPSCQMLYYFFREAFRLNLHDGYITRVKGRQIRFRVWRMAYLVQFNDKQNA